MAGFPQLAALKRSQGETSCSGLNSAPGASMMPCLAAADRQDADLRYPALRLDFSHAAPEPIGQGIGLLAEILSE